ncbi:MAG: chemotaxis protein CheA [Lachnospiraceae bacterium]|nr:chemotaxis protein CheA [Lachnospiraceae bacterium]
MDVSQYLEIFLDETDENLQNLNTQILTLEQEPENEECIQEIFRAAHTLKGMAGTMGFKRMQNLTHDMENVFSEVRDGTIKVNSDMIDTLFQTLDALETYLKVIRETGDEGTEENQAIMKKLNDILERKGDEAPAGDAGASDKDAGSDASGDAKEDKADASSDGAGWKSIKLDESQKEVIASSIKEGRKVFGLTIFIQNTCVLKAARAFMAFKCIEDAGGEVAVSSPSSQDIEDEKFDFEFSLIVVGDAELDDLKKDILDISEIEKVEGGPVPLDFVDQKEEASEAEAEETAAASQEKTQIQPAPETKPQGAAPAGKGAQTPAKQGDGKKPAKSVVNHTVRVDIEKLDVLMNLVSELIIAKNSLVSASNVDGEQNSAVNEQVEYLESVTTSLHESVMKVRMVPIESVVTRFPRMVRDLSKKLGKPMELYMTGEETELDRTVVDEIGDPLMHLLRNSADHGIESAEVRKERGKPETGSIFLDAYQDGNNVVIEVRDDGNGIDVEAVKNKAIERGVVTPEQASLLSEKEAISLLFEPGFSTAKVVSDVSGRGVGLDVVKSKIEALSGEVEVKSRYGEGSTWIIRLPLTLAIIQALMVIVGEEKYAISLGSIVTIEDVQDSDIKLVQNKEVINLRGTVIPILRLRDILETPTPPKEGKNMVVIIVKKGDLQAGLVVDELIGQQEIVIKSLGKLTNKAKMISGATILGDGEVALILDTNALF